MIMIFIFLNKLIYEAVIFNVEKERGCLGRAMLSCWSWSSSRPLREPEMTLLDKGVFLNETLL